MGNCPAWKPLFRLVALVAYELHTAALIGIKVAIMEFEWNAS